MGATGGPHFSLGAAAPLTPRRTAPGRGLQETRVLSQAINRPMPQSIR